MGEWEGQWEWQWERQREGGNMVSHMIINTHSAIDIIYGSNSLYVAIMIMLILYS